MIDQDAATDFTLRPAMTASGARIAALSPQSARGFLARFDHPVPSSIAIALGAFEEDRTLIGIALTGEIRNAVAPLAILVEPCRRRIKVGSDLLHAMTDEVARKGARRIVVTYPTDARGIDALLRSSGLLAASRRAGGEVTTVLFLPAPP